MTITDLPQFVPLMQKNITHNAEKLNNGNVKAVQLKWYVIFSTISFLYLVFNFFSYLF